MTTVQDHYDQDHYDQTPMAALPGPVVAGALAFRRRQSG